jgi:glyoxylase-like metal-dependent hydrolase (beta-lactamase superfamily II)
MQRNSINSQSFLLQPATFRLDGGGMYGIIPKPLWEKHSPPDQLNRIQLSLRLWLLKTADRLILIDTGLAAHQDSRTKERFDVQGPDHPIQEALAELQLSLDDITDLVISHLHFDHAGGMTHKTSTELEFAFRNAQLHLHRDHYQYALQPTARDTGSFHVHEFKPVIEKLNHEGRVTWHEGQEGELFDSLAFRCSHGHTPWLMHPYNDQYIYLADLIPTAHHVSIPWVMGYDIAPGQTTKDKLDFLNMIVKKNLHLIFEHDIDSWGASITSCEKRHFKISETFKAPLTKSFKL